MKKKKETIMNSLHSVLVLLIIYTAIILTNSWSIKSLFPFSFKPSTYAGVITPDNNQTNITTGPKVDASIIDAPKRRIRCKKGEIIDRRGACRPLW